VIHPRAGLAYLRTGGVTGFLVLGGVFLCVTGAEALYADMGHFGARPIRLAWSALVFPSLVLNYAGQAALILEGAPTVDMVLEGEEIVIRVRGGRWFIVKRPAQGAMIGPGRRRVDEFRDHPPGGHGQARTADHPQNRRADRGARLGRDGKFAAIIWSTTMAGHFGRSGRRSRTSRITCK
jgi:hypothetical protein